MYNLVASRVSLRACAAGVIVLSIMGCSAPNKSDSRPSLSMSMVPHAGTSVSPSTSSTPQRPSNSTSSLVPIPTANAGTGSTAMRPPAASTVITREPITIDECGAVNPAGLSPADAQKLKAGSGSPGALRWLYPYQGTVFPRGMLAPDLMWDGAPADVVYLHIKSKIFEYSGCLKPTAPGRIALAQDVWEKAAERSYGKDDDYLIELTTWSAGTALGPVQTHIQIAQAAIKGSIYYNTYRSGLLTGGAIMPGGTPADPFTLDGFATLNGMVVRIPPSGKAEPFGQTMDCTGCHSVSADGSRLLAQSTGTGAASYALTSNVATPAPTMAGSNGSWVGLYPDGSVALSMSTVIDVARSGIFGSAAGAANAALFDTKTGAPIPSVGIPPGTLMPFFSPDGTLLVLNDFAVEEAHGIVLMRYDTKTHTASEPKVLFKEPPGAMRPAWPFVLPDNRGVLFIRTDDFDFTGGGAGVFGAIDLSVAAPFGELSIVDVASKTVTVLAKAMGYNTPEDAASNRTYLPFGAEDLHHTYYPTVSPVGAGGYFWVFFDSVRHYGTLGLQRQLWGAAIDISADGTYTRDPSHPAFYVSGQEFGTGNHRAFAALDPCRKDGDRCSSGVDCCGGFCYSQNPSELTESAGTCSPKKMMCARRDERCSTSGDCCAGDPTQPPLICIAGFCAEVLAPD